MFGVNFATEQASAAFEVEGSQDEVARPMPGRLHHVRAATNPEVTEDTPASRITTANVQTMMANRIGQLTRPGIWWSGYRSALTRFSDGGRQTGTAARSVVT